VIHVLLASILPLLVFAALWWRRGRRASYASLLALPIACLASGLWAVVPDTPRLWRDAALYVDMHHVPYCDVWWAHCTIDKHDEIDSSMAFPALFVLIAIAVFAIGWRELRRTEGS
jgi:hypothetical protein